MVNTSNLQELKQKFQEVFSDESFKNELLQMEDDVEVQKALAEKGIELTLDEIASIREMSNKVQSGEISHEQLEHKDDGELSEDELMDVAGGGYTVEEFFLAVLFSW